MKPRPDLRFDPITCLERFMEMEAFRSAAILARARAEADACLTGSQFEAEPLYLFAEDAYFNN
ncbi:MAG TPA: hypothetical protein VFO11_14100 [Candidatus Polarisedimenticolaceae bacterium]|nr:hypothetical protein [Candidatus Polarisedimenticolaceae bacterium]